jgi:hypothetical protein
MSFFYNNRNPPLETKRTVRRDERPAERRYTLVHKDWDEEEEWEEDEDGCEFIEQQDIADLWRTIERNRATIAYQEARFQRWMQLSPELRKHWQAFIDAGGVTADDYSKFCAGKMRHRSTREKKHLRLVRDNPKPIRRIRLNPTGNDAA